MSATKHVFYPLAISLIALVVSAVALVSVFLGSPSSDSGSRDSASLVPAAGRSDAEFLDRLVGLLARVEGLDEENRDLRQQLARLEDRSDPTQQDLETEALVSRSEFESVRDQIVDLQTSSDALMAASDIPGEPEAFKRRFKESVAATLGEIRKEEAIKSVRSEHEKRLANLDRVVPRIEEWLDLTPYQTEEMRSAFLAKYEREAALLQLWEEGTAADEELGRQKMNARETFHNDLTLFLTPEQLKAAWPRLGGGGDKDR